jgi:hypothetical protein
MRAGFLGQNICALGFGIATLQAPRLVMDQPVEGPLTPPDEDTVQMDGRTDGKGKPAAPSVANSPRLHA